MRTFDGRLFGQSWETPFVPVGEGTIDEAGVATMIANFHEAYELRAGNRFEAIPVQGVTYRVHAALATEKVDYPTLPERATGALAPTGTTHAAVPRRRPRAGEVYERDDLRAGDVIDGPAIIREAMSTTHVGPARRAAVGELRRDRSSART